MTAAHDDHHDPGAGAGRGVPEGGVGVRWLGHASVVLDVGGARLLTDPLLRRHAGLLRRRGAAPAQEWWAGADAVLLSHLHHDHAELASLRMLEEVPVLTAPANARWLRQHGVAGALGVTRPWAVPGADVEVVPVPAVHGHRPMPHRPNAAGGFVVRTPRARIWFAGDTELFPAMTDVPRVAGGSVDVALVPVGGWGPRLSGGHMDPVQAARACALAGARAAVPVHWGTLHAPASRWLPPGWMDVAGHAFAAACLRVAPSVRPVVLRPGEAVRLPAVTEDDTPGG